ncbi:MAG: hypothetical protein Phyf2KO_26790 [Phycisphaerales bacterium]
MRNTSRTFWESAMLALWYALASLPALPAVWDGTENAARDALHNAACACVSCSDADACCCAPSGDAEDQEGPAWSPIDCSLMAGWLLAKQVPAVTHDPIGLGVAVSVDARRDCGIQTLEVREVGVPEPPPRIVQTT